MSGSGSTPCVLEPTLGFTFPYPNDFSGNIDVNQLRAIAFVLCKPADAPYADDDAARLAGVPVCGVYLRDIASVVGASEPVAVLTQRLV